MQRKPYRRRIKLIKPGLQLKLTLIFVSFSALALLMQFVLFASSLTEVALELPHDGSYMVERMGSLLFETLVSSLAMFLPLIFAVGILTTFRFAGPLYRFEMFLGRVMRREYPEDCRIRDGDLLHDFCDLLNRATAPLRERPADVPVETEGSEHVPSLAETKARAAESESKAR